STPTSKDGSSEPRSTGGVQSLSRAFAILEAMADAGGEIGLSQLATETRLPPATIHRLVRTLVDLGYVRQEPSRQYSLGPRLMRLVDASSKRLATLAHPYMSDVVDALGESVNLAVLDGEEEVGVRCVALAVPGAPRPVALSMSGPSTQMSDDVIDRAVPILRRAAERIGAELAAPAPVRVAGTARARTRGVSERTTAA